MKYPFLKIALCLLSCNFVACGGGNGDSPDNADATDWIGASRYTVSAEAGEGGTISPASQDVERQGTAVLSVVPDAGYAIAEVTGCGGSLSGTTYTTALITADCTVTATFTQQTYTITGTVTGLNGTLELLLALDDARESMVISGVGGPETFNFDTSVRPGDTYQVTIVSQPQNQECSVENGFGDVGFAGVEDVLIDCVSPEARAILTGHIEPAISIDIDSDVNDVFAAYADNSTPSQAQSISNRATLQGFASAEPTGGSEELENFASRADRDDFFRVDLQAGQRVEMQVVDYEGFDTGLTHEGDLDLYLYDQAGNLIGISDSISEFEGVVAPATGSYYAQVYAYSGISKYVLRLAPAATELRAPSIQALEFVPHQMIVKLKNASVGSAKTTFDLTFQHRQPGRATLATMENKSRKVQAGLNKALQELATLNRVTHAKVETLRAIKALRLQQGVVYAEPNYIRRTTITPNDPGYWYQWHYSAIQLPQAWDISTGTSSGADVIVAVIDTGVVVDHPDLREQLVSGFDFISDPLRARDGDGLDANADDPGDRNVRGQSSWHGTHVAGTIAAASNNTNGVAGTSWGANIMPVRVLGDGGGTSYDIIQGLLYAAGLANDSGTVPAQPANIANLSLGGPFGSLAEQDAYRAARNAGLIIIAAAGNENTDTPSYPAAYEGVIAVSATDFQNQRAPYSNYGNAIDVAAPGGNMSADDNGDGYPDGVISTVVDDTSGSRLPGYSFYHGTSMAAPHVAGVVALMKAVHPGLTPGEFDALLQSGSITDDLGSNGLDAIYGHGLINAFKALQVARDMASGTPAPETPPRIVATPSALNMEFETTAEITVSNEGGGTPEVTAVTTEAEWLTVNPADIGEDGLGRYTVSVDRSLLEDGFHHAVVIFTIDNAEQLQVHVYVQVGTTAPEGRLTQLYVLLLEKETEEVVATVMAEPVDGSSSVSYQFNEVAPGEYFIIAGSDIDVDFLICQSGESCGVYPTLANRQPVRVEDKNLTGLDFVANILGGFPTASSGDARVQPPHIIHRRSAGMKPPLTGKAGLEE